MKKIVYLLILFLLSFPSVSQTRYWSQIESINSNTNSGFTRPRIASGGGDGAVVIWGNNSNFNVYSSQRSSGSWSPPLKLNPTGKTIFTSDWAGPEIASNGNNVIVTFNALPENSEKPYTVISSDGGSSFNNEVQVTSNQWTRFPTPAIDENGKPYVAFMEFDSGFVDPHYAVATSSNGGTSYNSSVVGTSMAPGEVCDCCPAFLWADLKNVVLLFRNNDNDLRDIWASISTNSGTSFTKGADIDNNNWMINSCPSTGPDGVIDGDSITLVWMSGASGSSRINLGTADHSTVTIGRNFEISPNANVSINQNYPKISGSGDTIGVVWQESGMGKFYIKGKFSTTGVNGLKTAQVDTIGNPMDFAKFNPDITYGNGVFHITWQNNVQKSVMYRQVSFTGPVSILESKEMVEELIVYPNPATNRVNIEIPESLVGGQLTILDTHGQVVYEKESANELNSINTLALSKGFYYVLVTSNLSSISVKFQVN